MALVEADARLRAAAPVVGVADERAEMVEELVAELRHGGRGGAEAELAAVAVGREAAGFGDGIGFRGCGEPPSNHAAVDAADELERGFSVGERALPKVRDAALADVNGLASRCAVRGFGGSWESDLLWPRPRPSRAVRGLSVWTLRSIRPSAANASSSAWRST